MGTFKKLSVAIMACILCAGCGAEQDEQLNNEKFMEEKLNLAEEWDKVFPQSDKVIQKLFKFIYN